MDKWISVGTPPEETGTYLCALASRDMAILPWAPWPDCRGWYAVDRRNHIKPYNGSPVTHWMALPEPPQEDT